MKDVSIIVSMRKLVNVPCAVLLVLYVRKILVLCLLVLNKLLQFKALACSCFFFFFPPVPAFLPSKGFRHDQRSVLPR